MSSGIIPWGYSGLLCVLAQRRIPKDNSLPKETTPIQEGTDQYGTRKVDPKAMISLFRCAMLNQGNSEADKNQGQPDKLWCMKLEGHNI